MLLLLLSTLIGSTPFLLRGSESAPSPTQAQYLQRHDSTAQPPPSTVSHSPAIPSDEYSPTTSSQWGDGGVNRRNRRDVMKVIKTIFNPFKWFRRKKKRKEKEEKQRSFLIRLWHKLTGKSKKAKERLTKEACKQRFGKLSSDLKQTLHQLRHPGKHSGKEAGKAGPWKQVTANPEDPTLAVCAPGSKDCVPVDKDKYCPQGHLRPKGQKPVEMAFYDLLGVAFDATTSQIRKAYYKLGLKLHPDKTKILEKEPGGPEKREELRQQFMAISEAYEKLGQDDTRKLYNECGAEAFESGWEDGAAGTPPNSEEERAKRDEKAREERLKT